jgi:hypothetical protein
VHAVARRLAATSTPPPPIPPPSIGGSGRWRRASARSPPGWEIPWGCRGLAVSRQLPPATPRGTSHPQFRVGPSGVVEGWGARRLSSDSYLPPHLPMKPEGPTHPGWLLV